MSKLQNCIEDIQTWRSLNFLKLNEDKTEYIMFGTRHQLGKIEPLDSKVGPAFISPVEGVRNLGFYMENLLKNHHHINRICSQLFCIINLFRQSGPRLDHDMAEIIIQALVLSKLDYCCIRLLQYLLPFPLCLGLYVLSICFAYSLNFSCSSSGLLVFAHLGSINFIAHQ